MMLLELPNSVWGPLSKQTSVLKTPDFPLPPEEGGAPSTAWNKIRGISGKKIRNMKRSKFWAWKLIAGEASPATAPVAHPTLDSGLQVPEAADERGDGFQYLHVSPQLGQLRRAGPLFHQGKAA